MMTIKLFDDIKSKGLAPLAYSIAPDEFFHVHPDPYSEKTVKVPMRLYPELIEVGDGLMCLPVHYLQDFNV